MSVKGQEGVRKKEHAVQSGARVKYGVAIRRKEPKITERNQQLRIKSAPLRAGALNSPSAVSGQTVLPPNPTVF